MYMKGHDILQNLLYPCVLPYQRTWQNVKRVLQKSTYKVVLNSYDKCQKLHFSPMQVWYLSCDFVTSLSLGKLHFGTVLWRYVILFNGTHFLIRVANGTIGISDQNV